MCVCVCVCADSSPGWLRWTGEGCVRVQDYCLCADACSKISVKNCSRKQRPWQRQSECVRGRLKESRPQASANLWPTSVSVDHISPRQPVSLSPSKTSLPHTPPLNTSTHNWGHATQSLHSISFARTWLLMHRKDTDRYECIILVIQMYYLIRTAWVMCIVSGKLQLSV